MWAGDELDWAFVDITTHVPLPGITMRANLKPPECRAGLRWVALGWARLGWAGGALGWAALGWVALGWAREGWAGLGWAGLG